MRSKASLAETEPRGPHRADAGFLYLELLAAFGILAVLLVSTFPVLLLAARVSSAAEDLTVEADLARDKAESLQAVSYETVSGGSDSFKIDKRTYLRSWTVQADIPFAGMKTISVTVQPARHLKFGASRVYTLSFVRAE